jgi:hypothetical protein
MGSVTERVTEQSPQLSRTILKSISGLIVVSVFFSLGANGVYVEGHVSTGTHTAKGAAGQAQEFYISLSTDERDLPSLSTLVVAGWNRFMFDCGAAASVPGDVVASPAASALFLTHLDTPTADGISRALVETFVINEQRLRVARRRSATSNPSAHPAL